MLVGMAIVVAPFSGKRLKELRKVAGLTQKQLADEIGSRERDVQRWEAYGAGGDTGHRPSAKYLPQLIRRFPDLFEDTRAYLYPAVFHWGDAVPPFAPDLALAA